MRTAAMILGILGGLAALVLGTGGFLLGSIASISDVHAGGTLKAISIGIPVIALIGGGMARSKPIVSASLLGISAIGLLLILGFNVVSLFPLVLIVLAALLAFMGANQNSTAGQQKAPLE